MNKFYKNIKKNVLRYFSLVRILSNWWVHLGIKFGLTAAEPVLFRTRRGILIEAPRELLVDFREIFMSESYRRGMAFTLGENPVVLDIGANVGFFTLYILSRLQGARVICYEPLAANFRQLERNLQINSGYHVTCFQKAVAGRSGDLNLHYDSRNEYTTTASIHRDKKGNTETITVAAVSLPDVFEENGLKRCDLLKMDCEGAEYEILYNCPREIMDRIGNIVLEVHDVPGRNNINSLKGYLTEMGFAIQRSPIHRNSAISEMLLARRGQAA